MDSGSVLTDFLPLFQKIGESGAKNVTRVECVRSQNKKAVFKTRDLNSAINILNLTKKWIEKKERPEEFKSKYRSSPSESEDKVEP